MERAGVAKQVGFSQCRVSVPLSQDEVLLNARLLGVPEPEKQIDWAQLRATYRPSDQIRFVACTSGNTVRAPGYSFFGLFRGNSAIFQLFQVVDN